MGVRALHQHASRTTSHESIIARCGTFSRDRPVAGLPATRHGHGSSRASAPGHRPSTRLVSSTAVIGASVGRRVLDMPLYGERRCNGTAGSCPAR